MGHPTLDEFIRAKQFNRVDFLRRCQREFREDVQPMYERGVDAEIALAAKDAEIAELRAKLDEAQTNAKQAKRKADPVPA